jgi:hypothetical protein
MKQSLAVGYDLSRRSAGRLWAGQVPGVVLPRLLSLADVRRLVRFTHAGHNDPMFEGADILAEASIGRRTINGMYVEFINLALPTDPTPVPGFTRADGVDYFNNLSSSPDTDYIRLSLLLNPTLETSDITKYDGNQPVFCAVTAGVVGFHGKPFGSASNSAVYGGALVSIPDPGDQSRDKVYARSYNIGKLLKQSGHEIAVLWKTQLR